VSEYLKALATFGALVAAGVVLLAFGYDVEGKTAIVAAPFASGLVAAVPNQPRARRHRGSGRRQADR
jgi:hypothetical protein